jgi:hypothetical protein
MKITLLNVFILFVCISPICSQNISVAPNPAYATADLDNLSTHPEDMIAEAFISNNTSDTLFMKWERILDDTPEDWKTAVCDANICVFPDVSSNEFVLYPNETGFSLLVHAYPGGDPSGIFENDVYPGEGEVHLKITNLNDPSDTLVAVYFFTLIGGPILDLVEPELEKINIFPNPAGNYFTLTETKEIQSLIIYNILGHPVKTFAVNVNRQFEIDDLPGGSYFVSLIDKDQKKVKILRLQKH